MELTPEERRHIYEEEKARLEAEEQVRAEARADFAALRETPQPAATEAVPPPSTEAVQRSNKGDGRWTPALVLAGVVLTCIVLFALIAPKDVDHWKRSNELGNKKQYDAAITELKQVPKDHYAYELVSEKIAIFREMKRLEAQLGITPSSEGGETSSSNPVAAYIESQSAVKARLKAPSTAEFPWYDASMVSGPEGGVLTVRSYVDAQNGFGAKIRSNYVVKLREAGGGEFVVEDVAIF